MAITQLKTIESNYSQYININVVDNLKVWKGNKNDILWINSKYF
jgi:hypothetical protein